MGMQITLVLPNQKWWMSVDAHHPGSFKNEFRYGLNSKKLLISSSEFMISRFSEGSDMDPSEIGPKFS